MHSVTNSLQLRAGPIIGLGFLAGAFVGGLVGSAGTWLLAADQGQGYISTPGGFLESVAFIGFGCLIVELLVGSPFLYRVSRGRYLNRLTAPFIGLAVGATPMLLILSQPLGDGTSEFLGYFAHGHLTMSGYWRLLRGAAWSGSIGFASAATLAWIAIGDRKS